MKGVNFLVSAGYRGVQSLAKEAVVQPLSLEALLKVPVPKKLQVESSRMKEKQNWIQFIQQHPNATSQEVYGVYKKSVSKLPQRMREGPVRYDAV